MEVVAICLLTHSKAPLCALLKKEMEASRNEDTQKRWFLALLEWELTKESRRNKHKRIKHRWNEANSFLYEV